MNTWALAWRYVASRPASNLLTALGVGIGVLLLTATLALTAATRESLQRGAGGYQLLIAAKGSAVQAVLSTLFFMDAPTGNIPVALYRQLQADAGVTRLVPFIFGDSYRGHLIVGTTVDYFALLADSGRGPSAADPGRLARPFDAVVGATAARQAGLAVGSRFVASHGLVELPAELATDHADRQYHVTAVLSATGSPADRAIFTALETGWLMHEQEGDHAPAAEASPRGEITALLVQGRSYGDMARIAASLARDTRVQAVVPGREVTRLLQYLRAGEEVVLGLAWLATAVAFFAVMLSMAAAGIDRRRQIATLRALGASRAMLARLLIAESLLIAGAGAALGFVLGRAAAAAIAWHVEGSRGFPLELTGITPGELAAPGAALLLGLVAGAIPAWFTCREDIVPHLSNAP